MLVLTRKHQEKIRIGEHITITVLKTKGKTVRLGIEAPAEVPVIRGELSFAGEEFEWPATAAEDNEPRASQATEKTSHVDRMRDHWPTESAKNDAARQVSLQRISRRELNQFLPKDHAAAYSSGGAAPLRAIMTRRSVSA